VHRFDLREAAPALVEAGPASVATVLATVSAVAGFHLGFSTHPLRMESPGVVHEYVRSSALDISSEVTEARSRKRACHVCCPMSSSSTASTVVETPRW
jgi:hypothetical protein